MTDLEKQALQALVDLSVMQTHVINEITSIITNYDELSKADLATSILDSISKYAEFVESLEKNIPQSPAPIPDDNHEDFWEKQQEYIRVNRRLLGYDEGYEENE